MPPYSLERDELDAHALGDIVEQAVFKQTTIIDQHLIRLQLFEQLIDIVYEVADILDQRECPRDKTVPVSHIQVARDIIVHGKHRAAHLDLTILHRLDILGIMQIQMTILMLQIRLLDGHEMNALAVFLLILAIHEMAELARARMTTEVHEA